MVGQRIGPYEVVAKLGEGGMGEVYKARDTSLGRDVAIKVLPVAVANDPERLRRFEREAKLLASLSHTNIAQIYGLEKTSGAGATGLVMELAAGDDLTAYVHRGAMSLQDALLIAAQIALALEAAHERGIVHRDLKPANVKVTADGAVKVLDFGLAKALDPNVASGSMDAMNSPTLTAQATAVGVILGTAAYMSPEQVRGREADKRVDVWAFGVVFFEMLTGARLFQGETISDTLAAVLGQDIPWSALPAGTPAEIQRLLRRCLERDRKNRLHDIADARIVLEEVARGGSEEPAAAPITPKKRPWWLLGAATLAILALGFAGGRWTAPKPAGAESATVRVVIPMPAGVIHVEDPAVAPDGSFVVFVGENPTGQRLFLQRLDESSSRPIDRTEGAYGPVISPDGKWIAYNRTTRLEKIAVDGGEPILITDVNDHGGAGLAWLPNHLIVFAKTWSSGLMTISDEGGATRTVSTPDTARGEMGHLFPSPLPDGRHLLITVWKKGTGINDAETGILDLESGKHTILFKGFEARYLAPGFIVFYRAGAFHAIRFNPETRTVAGEAVRVLDDAWGNLPEGTMTQADIGASGTVAYLSGPPVLPRELAWIAEGGKVDVLRFPARQYYGGVDLAPDGKRAVVTTLDAGRYVMRVLDLNRGNETVLDLPGVSFGPVWHPDGKRLAFGTMLKGDFDTYWMDLTTGAPPTPLLATDFDEGPASFAPDGTALIVHQSESDGRSALKLLPLPPSGAPRTLTPVMTYGQSRMSRDGKFVAFVSLRTGWVEINVMPVTGGIAPDQISRTGGSAVAWSPNGRELLYLRAPEIVAVTFTVDNGKFRPGAERVWAHVEGNYASGTLVIGSDGRPLVAIDRKKTVREIRVILNWQAEVAKKVK